jgi:hypothetical protein
LTGIPLSLGNLISHGRIRQIGLIIIINIIIFFFPTFIGYESAWFPDPGIEPEPSLYLLFHTRL